LFFEGSEKKLEVFVTHATGSLIDNISDLFWHELVESSGAKILSQIENKQCKAFLLSESSLFVWHDRFILITCGITNLINSVRFFIDKMGKDSIANLKYQRKNEYCADEQVQTFDVDTLSLNQWFDGYALCLGKLNDHHVRLYSTNIKASKSLPCKRLYASYNNCVEFVAYQISTAASDKLTAENLTAEQIRAYLNLTPFLSGFEFNDYVFEPYGYSINAIQNDKYFTIHVTPQAESSYVSFESNINIPDMIPNLLAVLSPKLFDLLSYNDADLQSRLDHLLNQTLENKYIAMSNIEKTVSNDVAGYFSHCSDVKATNT